MHVAEDELMAFSVIAVSIATTIENTGVYQFSCETENIFLITRKLNIQSLK